MKRPRILRLVILSILFGAFIGAFTWFFMVSYERVITLVWEKGAQAANLAYYPLIVCGVGGVFVGLAYKFLAPVPEPLSRAMATIAKTKRLEYDHLKDAVVAAFTSLVFGGSIGPEAGLTSIVGGLCTWVGDKNKACFKRLHEGKTLGMKDVIAILRTDTRTDALPSPGSTKDSAGNPPYLVDYFARRRILIAAAVVAGLGVYVAFQMTPLRNDPWLFNHFPNASLPGVREIAATVILIAIGLVLGLFNQFSQRVLSRIEPFSEKYRIGASIIAGLILGAVAIRFPYVLFSGELQMQELVLEATTLTAITLVITAFLKMFLTSLILACGWKGGQIFPIVFSGFALGIASALAASRLGFPLEPAWCVAIVCTTAASIALGQPLLIALILLPIFPWQTWPGIAVAAACIFVFLRVKKRSKVPRDAEK